MKGTASLDAPVADLGTHPMETTRPRPFDMAALAVAIATVVAVSLVRVVNLGFAGIAPDDAAYVGVGRALWGLQEPLGIDGTLYTIRSWAYPVMTGGASRLFEGGLFSGDLFTGPRVLGWVLGTSALALAVVVGYRLARGAGAVATAVALLATPVLWTIVPTTRVDVALIWFTVVVLLVMDTPTPRRMLIGGVLAGLTLLVKETSAPLVVLPLAYLGTMPRDEWRRLAARYLVGFVGTVGWWFVTVLVLAGEIFPLEGIRHASDRDVPRDWTLNTSARLLIAAWVAGWLVVAIGRRRDPRARLLVLAGLAFVPASLIAWEKEFALRQFGPIVLLSCIALGVAVVQVLAATIRRVPRGAARRLAAPVAVVAFAVALVPVILTQDRTVLPPSPGSIDRDLARWIMARPGKPIVVSTVRYEAQLWARVEGEAEIRPLQLEDQVESAGFGHTAWADWRRGSYHVLPREELARRLRGADYLVLSGPDRFGPIGLAIWLQRNGAAIGITPVAHFGPRSGRFWAYVYRLRRPRVGAIPTVISTMAAEQMVADGTFHPVEPMVIAGTRGGFIRLGRAIPIDKFEQLAAPLY